MEEKILWDLYCFQCSLQFDKKTIYDIHLKIMHNYISRKESEIKEEPEENHIAGQWSFQYLAVSKSCFEFRMIG